MFEPGLLRGHACLALLRRKKVRERSGRRRDAEGRQERRDLVPADAGAHHPGVDAQVPIHATGRAPGVDLARAAERHREARRRGRRILLGEYRRADEDHRRHAPVAQREALGHRGHAKSHRIQRGERARNVQRAQTVRVGLEHRHQARAGVGGEPRRVAAHGVEVDVDPRAGRGRRRLARGQGVGYSSRMRGNHGK